MTEDTQEISSRPLQEVIINMEDIADLARSFQWVSLEKNELGESKTNLKVIEESVTALADSGMINDTAKELEWLRQTREVANGVYKEIYPSEQQKNEPVLEAPYYYGIEPFYHGIGTAEDWTGHNDYVMAATARIFSGLVRIKKEGSEAQKAELDEFLGTGWQDIELTAADFRSLMTMGAFHETGEWWVKTFWQKGIDKQRQQFNSQREEGIPVEEMKIDPTLRNVVRELPENERQEGIAKMTKVIEKMKPIVEPLGLAIDYDSQEEASEFTVFFQDGKKEDVAFIPKSRFPETVVASKPAILASIFKAADFCQCFCPSYTDKVTYIPEGEESERINKLKGSLALYVDFYSFKPGALPAAGWKDPWDVELDDFFYNELLVPYAKNERVFTILDWALKGQNNYYRQAADDLDRKRREIG